MVEAARRIRGSGTGVIVRWSDGLMSRHGVICHADRTWALLRMVAMNRALLVCGPGRANDDVRLTAIRID